MCINYKRISFIFCSLINALRDTRCHASLMYCAYSIFFRSVYFASLLLELQYVVFVAEQYKRLYLYEHHRSQHSSPAMSTERIGGASAQPSIELASEAELEGYGRAISQELDKAEAELNAPRSRPFGGLGSSIMADVQRLRTEQFDMFRRHVEIEQQYRVASPVAEPRVRSMSFSAIADTMREKESATASLLNRLADFDDDLRQVIANVENAPTGKADPSKRVDENAQNVQRRTGELQGDLHPGASSASHPRV